MKHILPICLIFFVIPFVLADSQIEVTATISDIATEDNGTVVLQMQLNADFLLPVRVTGDTELSDENDDELQVEDLKEGMLLRIKGLFTSEGILANEITVKGDESGFRIKGMIQEIPDGTSFVAFTYSIAKNG